ncbi:MAG: hypothetical protein K8S16_04915 [Bacteroidales bacterium]|nr:hypothetical protein [Bacteroidales bacterium]
MGLTSYGQDKPKKFIVNGHLQNLNTVWIEDVKSQWHSMGSIYNRLNLKYYMHNNWTFSASARNVMTYGQLVYENYPYYSELMTTDNGYMDLTGAIAKDSSYVFFTNIDRANLQFSKGKFDVRVGRQRINWGINMVWNPNDIFNTFNYYDFDYAERPGCDAVRVQYYTGATSSFEGGIKIDANDKVTAAMMYKFNNWNYDFQVMGGVMEDDIVIGGGWSGYIKNAGFTGEGSWFRDKNNFADTTGIFVLSAGGNYTFKNSLFLHGSLLYNSNGTTGKAGWGTSFIGLQDMSPKTFSLAKYSIFGQASFPFTPLINGDLSMIANPNDGSMFLGPNLSFSLSDNITLLFMSQIFIGDEGAEFGNMGSLYYLRLKWSF